MRPFVADLHTHTIVSGHAYGTMQEMARAAADAGLQLLGITDHAPGIPGTVDAIYFRNLPHAPRSMFGIELLHGSEVNVLPGGELSLNDRTLSALDYAIAGIHGHCYTDEGAVKNTDAVIRCMEHPKVRFISHPDSNGFPMDYPALVQGAKANCVALELNNSSLRNLAGRPGCLENYRAMIPLCMEHGVPIIINTDAHDPTVVGKFDEAYRFLETLEINEDLILNNDLTKLKRFLLEPKQTNN